MMAFLTASGLIISAKESRKIRLKEAKSGKEGIPKSVRITKRLLVAYPKENKQLRDIR